MLVIGPGIDHPCTPAVKKRNLIKLISKQEEKVKEEIIGNSLHCLATEQSLAGSSKGHLELSNDVGNKSKLSIYLEKLGDIAELNVNTFKKGKDLL